MSVGTGKRILSRKHFSHSPKKILPFEVKFQTLNSVLPIYVCAIYWTCSSFRLEKKVTIKWPKKFILKEKNIQHQTMSIYPLHQMQSPDSLSTPEGGATCVQQVTDEQLNGQRLLLNKKSFYGRL